VPTRTGVRVLTAIRHEIGGVDESVLEDGDLRSRVEAAVFALI
jgi:hypothetical protein